MTRFPVESGTNILVHTHNGDGAPFRVATSLLRRGRFGDREVLGWSRL